MKSFLRRAVFSAAFLFSAVLAPCLTHGQDSSVEKPAVEVAVKSIDGIMEDVKYGMEQAGYGDQAGMLQAGLAFLNGVDTSKPIGVRVWFDGEKPQILAGLPVSDYDSFLDLVSQSGMDIEEEDDMAIMELPNGQTIFMKSANGYVFVSESEDAVEKLPKTPAVDFNKLRGSRMFSARVHVQRIPKSLRDQAVELMEEGFDRAMENNAAGDNIAEMQQRINEVSMKNLAEVVQKSDKIEFGFTMDQKNAELRWDLEFTGVEGSKMARQGNANVGKSGKLANFLLDDVAAHFYGFSTVLEEDKANIKDMLSAITDAMKEEIKAKGKDAYSSLIDDMSELVQAAADNGRVDFGAAVDTGEKLNMFMGASIGDGAKFEAIVKKIAADVKENGKGDIEISSTTVAGIKFTVLKRSSEDENVARVFGDAATIMAGNDGKIGYLAIGADPSALIKKVVANKKESKEMFRYNLRIAKLLNFASNVMPNVPEEMEAMLDVIDEGKDRVTVTGTAIKNGSKASLKVDAAILKLIGAAIQSAQGGPQF